MDTNDTRPEALALASMGFALGLLRVLSEKKVLSVEDAEKAAAEATRLIDMLAAADPSIRPAAKQAQAALLQLIITGHEGQA